MAIVCGGSRRRAPAWQAVGVHAARTPAGIASLAVLPQLTPLSYAPPPRAASRFKGLSCAKVRFVSRHASQSGSPL